MPDPKDTSKTQRLKKILWESNINAPVRGFYNLMNTPYEDLMGSDRRKLDKAVGESFDVAAGVTGGSAMVPKPKNALTMGAGRSSKPRGEAGSKPGQKKLMEKLNKSRDANAAARSGKGGSKGRSGTLSERLEGTRTRPRTEKEANKFGPLVKRQENVPATQGSRAVVKRKENLPATTGGSRALTVAREGKGNLPATTGTRTFGDKARGLGTNAKRGLGINAKRALAALAVGGAAYGLYKGADKSKATQKEGPRDDRASSLSGSKSDKAAAFKAKQQGMKTKGSPTNPSSGTKKAGDKSRMAKPEKKMSSFERMKMRQYEKEGRGGRSMTSEKAKAQVKKERSYKFKDLFN